MSVKKYYKPLVTVSAIIVTALLLFWGKHKSQSTSSSIHHPIRTKRSVEAFFQEEVNNIDRSELFLDVFVSDEYKTIEYNQNGSEQDDESDVEPVFGDSTFIHTFIPASARHRRTRSIDENPVEKILQNPELLEKLEDFLYTYIPASSRKRRTRSVDDGGGDKNKVEKPEKKEDPDEKINVPELLQKLKDLNDPDLIEWAEQVSKKINPQGKGVNGTSSITKDELGILNFLLSMIKDGKIKANGQRDDPEKVKVVEPETTKDPSCIDLQPILSTDTREQVREKQGHRMKCYMNFDKDPCDNFYDYACGNWDLYYPIPRDRGGYDTFEILREELDQKLRQLLEEPQKDGDSSTTTAVKTLYTSCMNTDKIEERGESPLVTLLEEMGGWPVLANDDWDEDKFDWIDVIGQLRLYNNDILVSLWVGPDGKKSDQYIVQFDQSDLVLPSSEYYHQGIEHPIMKAYQDILTNVAVLLGAQPKRAKKHMHDVIKFEIELAKIMTPPHERRNFSKIYKKKQLPELQASIPGFNFTQYLDIVLPMKISSNESIVIYASEYFNKLTKLVKETKKDVLANYVLMRFIRHRINNLDKRFEKIQNELYRLLYGREEMPARWKFCIAYVNGNLGMSVGSLFVRKYFDSQSKQDMLHLTSEIQKQFEDLVMDVEWLSNNTKDTARDKIGAMIHNIGYPDLVLEDKQLQKEIGGLNYTESAFFENVLKNLAGRTEREMSLLGQRVNRTIWTTTPAVVNAYYSRNRNQIMFPAGILQPPFYHKFFPKALNYGGIGVVIGHEITHGFDDKGKQFDAQGNINQWWDSDSSTSFKKKAQCIIDQYSEFSVSEVGVNLNGMNTQGENIADNGGIKQSFGAYTQWIEDHGEEEPLPKIPEVTPRQLFFLNFAQVWCGTARPEALRSKLKTAVHAPGKYRVLGTLANSEDFAEAFSCKAGQKMHPEDKCQVW